MIVLILVLDMKTVSFIPLPWLSDAWRRLVANKRHKVGSEENPAVIWRCFWEEILIKTFPAIRMWWRKTKTKGEIIFLPGGTREREQKPSKWLKAASMPVLNLGCTDPDVEMHPKLFWPKSHVSALSRVGEQALLSSFAQQETIRLTKKKFLLTCLSATANSKMKLQLQLYFKFR